MKQHSGLFSSITQLKGFFWGGGVGGVDCSIWVHAQLQVFADIIAEGLCLLLLLLLPICRILHLAIIHEEEFIAQQLIQLFPKNVLDIQNNLYQVSLTHLFHTSQQLLLEFPDPQPLPLSAGVFFMELVPLFLCLCYLCVHVKCCTSLFAVWQSRHCGWFRWHQLFRDFEWKPPPFP